MTTYLYPKNLKSHSQLMAVEFERFCNYLYSAFVVCAYVCTDTVFSTTCCNSMLRFPYNPT